jgi:hypothetical protein
VTRLPSIVVTIVSVLALGWPAHCAAQMYRPERAATPQDGPSVNLQLSMAAIDVLNAELDDDFRTLDAFSKKRGIDRLPTAAQLHGEWKLYGRFYLVNFQNKLDEPETVTRFTWRRSGPRVGGARIYILLHRQF